MTADRRCGSVAGYLAHRTRKEKPCDDCRNARNAYRRANEPRRGPRQLAPIADRFWPKVDKSGPVPDRRPDLGPCWLWTAYRDDRGYGKVSRGGRRGGMESAHRVAYRLVIGEIPEGLELDHLCVVPACVNPAHLEPVPHIVNSRRSSAGAVNSARLKAQTECHRGHPFDEANTQIQRNGARRCRRCSADRQAARRAQRRAEA